MPPFSFVCSTVGVESLRACDQVLINIVRQVERWWWALVVVGIAICYRDTAGNFLAYFLFLLVLCWLIDKVWLPPS